MKFRGAPMQFAILLMTLLIFANANAEPTKDTLSLYHAGRYQEETLGDLEEAIKLYRQLEFLSLPSNFGSSAPCEIDDRLPR